MTPIILNISFTSKASKGNSSGNLMLFRMFVKALGCAISNIDDANIKLKGIKLENCYDNPTGIGQKLLVHYKESLTVSIFKLLGSIDLIGNPVGLFSNIGSGVSDLIEKPKEGFIKGPLEGGAGIVKGALSLGKHTVAGIFNSISKITASIASGISVLSLVIC